MRSAPRTLDVVNKRGRVLGFIFFAVCLVRCGVDEEPLRQSRVLTRVDKVFEAVCDYQIRCGTTRRPLTLDLSQQFCHPTFQAEAVAAVESRIETGRVALDDDALTACLVRLETAPCVTYEFVPAHECAPLLVPRRTVGETCVYNDECIDGFCRTNGQCPSRCEPAPVFGEACTDFPGCAAGLRCLDGRCHAPDLLEGAACVIPLYWPIDPCADGLRCLPNDPGANCAGGDADCGCRKPAAAGESCPWLTVINPCEEGLTCAYDGVCSEPHARDGSCTIGTECEVGLTCLDGACVPSYGPDQRCDEAGVCVRGFACIAETCRPHALEGDACGSTEACRAPMTCHGGRCTQPLVGEPCHVQGVCTVGAYCSWETETCVPTPTPGDACPDGVCVDWAFCPDRVCVARTPTGQPCAASNSCALGASCVGDVCVRDAELGEPCSNDGPWCDQKWTCDFETNRCVAYFCGEFD